MGFVNDTQKQNIAEAIRQAELKTSGEFVAVIAAASDDYYYIPTLWAALLALVLPAVWVALPLPLVDYSLIQMGVFVLAALALQWTPLKMWVIPRAVRQRRAALRAREQFLAQNLHHTAERNGVLFYVSVAERYVEIIADQGINQRVAAETWDTVVAEFIRQVHAGQIEAGFIGAIEACGQMLAQHFPASDGDVNELPNHLIELE